MTYFLIGIGDPKRLFRSPSKGIEVAEALSLSPSSVSRIVESGEKILLCRETAFSEKEEWSFLEDED